MISELLCKQCNIFMDENTVCYNCGLVNDIEISNYEFVEPEIIKKSSQKYNKYTKIQKWNVYSKEENTEYKSVKYTTELCKILKIDESLIPEISTLVSKVTEAIKKNYDGSKRAKVKNGIIIMCIYNISKNNDNYNYNYIEMAKVINLEMKYVSRADKTILELINCNKLKLPDEFIINFQKIESPINYITQIIKKYSFDKSIINDDIINQLSDLIEICDDNDLLSDHTPLSIGVGCFYYILNIHNILINVKMFSKIYDISVVTILKIFNILKINKTKLEKFGIV